ncbi:RT0821/Lpp0805 family surface protein [Photobacterium sp. SP02]|uniref:RT0821/Lpp0805 family surface protein n=1 Tax=Photobacterium sp. SP02 TaxID=3032280 RepID=UPI003144E74D
MHQTVSFMLSGSSLLLSSLILVTSGAHAADTSFSAGKKLALLSGQQPIYSPQVNIEKRTGRITREELKNGVMDSRHYVDIDDYLARQSKSNAAVPPDRHYVVNSIRVTRPYGSWYAGYGQYRTNQEAINWLGFTAIHFELLNQLNEHQQRRHEQAQITATTSPVGRTVQWQDGTASGSVKAMREGTTTSGRYCREFQQMVTVNETTETAVGTACKLPDGTWEVVSTG